MKLIIASIFLAFSFCSYSQITYPIVDTDVIEFYSDDAIISEPIEGDAFYGQDATYSGNQTSYTDNGDGTITDNVTGLMWEQEMGDKITYAEAFIKAENSTLGGHTDWRVPTMKELYSLIIFTGRVQGATAITMFIDTTYFNQPIGDISIGEREIDAQTWSRTQYVGLTMLADTTVFGVNFVDGRIKGYPKYRPGPNAGDPMTMYFRMVRGNSFYGINDFTDNNDGTITDNATGLMWQQADDGTTRDWEQSMFYAENLTLAGYSDWRLPNSKELQSIVDYSRCPDVTNSPAIDPLFSCTTFNDPDGNPGQYGYYWAGTSHLDGANPYSSGVYIAFGEAQGQMETPPNSGNYNLLDVHGAGSQRSDPKSGNFADYPTFWGPQGDVRYVYNYVRAVRDVGTTSTKDEPDFGSDINVFPNPATTNIKVESSAEAEFNKIELFNLQGQCLQSILDINHQEVTMDVSNFQSGIYLLGIHTNQGNETRKIVVK